MNDRFERGCLTAIDLLRRYGNFKLMLLGFFPAGSVSFTCKDPNNPWQKSEMARLAAVAFRRFGCEEYHVVSEVWYAQAPADSPLPDQVASMPNKLEGLLICSYRADGPGRLRIYRIVRDDAGAISDLVLEPEFQEAAGKMQGRFSGLLAPEGAEPLSEGQKRTVDRILALIPPDWPVQMRRLGPIVEVNLAPGKN